MKRLVILILVCCSFVAHAQMVNSDSKFFPIPECLKDNVEFWKIIYTQISTSEGLIHDRDYPLIIYDRIYVGNLYGKRLDDYTEKYKKRIILAIRNVRSNNRSTWGPLERKIKLLYKDYPASALKDVDTRVRFQLGQKERFLEGLERSGALIDTIRSILAMYNVPLRLAYLPHVESSFDYSAYSRVGAAGIWQFMPETGREYLRITKYVDERRDPILSTYAAARLLAHNFKVLGSWPLAITAYNHGLSGVMNAVKKTGSRDIGIIVTKHESPSFRFASKNFYSCFIAASEIAENPQKYFGKINYSPKRSSGHQLMLNTELYPFEICKMLGLTEEEMTVLNPSILPAIFKKQIPLPGGTRIVINSYEVYRSIEVQNNRYFKIYMKSQKNSEFDFFSMNDFQTKSLMNQFVISNRKSRADTIFNLDFKWPDTRYVQYYYGYLLNRLHSGFVIRALN